MRLSLASRPATGLPIQQAGRFPRQEFRGLPGVHPRTGLRGRWTVLCGPLSPERFSLAVTSLNRSGRCKPKRQLLSGYRTRNESAPFHGALQNFLYPAGLCRYGQQFDNANRCGSGDASGDTDFSAQLAKVKLFFQLKTGRAPATTKHCILEDDKCTIPHLAAHRWSDT